jgi:phospholipase/carboxylesterase
MLGLASELTHAVEVTALRAPYPHYSGYMWFDFQWDDGWTLDEAQAQSSLEGIVSYLEATASIGKPVLGGFSQGAIMSLAAAFTVPERLAGLVLLSGTPVRPELPKKALNGLPVFISHGYQDPVLPVVEARKITPQIEEFGGVVTYREYPAAHTVPYEALEDLDVWLDALQPFETSRISS